MKRRVIQMAGKTHVVSLPSGWVKEFGVKKGDELDVNEYGNKVVVSCGKGAVGRKTVFDMDGMNTSLVWRHMLYYYKNGYDEVKAVYSGRHVKGRGGVKASIREVMYEINNELVGFEIVSEGKSHFLFREISFPSVDEFDNILRRAHYSIKNLNDGLLECIERRDYGELKLMQTNAELNVNKMTNLLIRMLNKGVEKRELHVVLHLIEDVGDAYKDIVRAFVEKKEGVRREIVDFLKQVNQLYDFYLSYFNKRSRDVALKFEDLRERLLSRLESYECRNNDELRIVSQMKRVAYNLAELLTSQIE